MYYLRLLANFLIQMFNLVGDVPVVFRFMKKLGPNEIPPQHPWATGEDPEDGELVWAKNILYASPSELEVDDVEVVTKVGMFLRSMVKRSTKSEEIPHGPKRRMPHAVNYIHGSVHYNGAWMLFDDCRDLRRHLTDPQFRKDLQKWVKQNEREVTIVMRERDIDPTEYAFCVAAMRAFLPYFTNGNAPTKEPVLWGNKSPYFALNPINGSWEKDLDSLVRGEDVVRPPVTQTLRREYLGTTESYPWIERFMAWVMFVDVRARGLRGNIFFSDRKVFEPNALATYKEKGGYWKWFNVARVPFPGRELHTTSVIIPTLNEAQNLPDCLTAVRNAFGDIEVIVVDGGSTDETRNIAAEFGARVTYTSGGRGAQLDFGATLATGDVLCFLHADTKVDAHVGRRLRRHFSKASNQICTLRLRFDTRNPVYKILGWVTRLDGLIFSYGDQGIVVRRSFYDAIGGFRPLRNFEDIDFFQRARRSSRIRSARAKIRVSPRRFKQNGLFRELAMNSALMVQYALGTDPSSLATAYRQRPPHDTNSAKQSA